MNENLIHATALFINSFVSECIYVLRNNEKALENNPTVLTACISKLTDDELDALIRHIITLLFINLEASIEDE